MRGANTATELRYIADALKVPLEYIGTIHDLEPPYKVGEYLILITPEKNSMNGHWVAMKVGKTRSYYFDSYGQPPPRKLEQALNLYQNRTQIQALNQNYCGIYSVYFLKSGFGMLKSFKPIRRWL